MVDDKEGKRQQATGNGAIPDDWCPRMIRNAADQLEPKMADHQDTTAPREGKGLLENEDGPFSLARAIIQVAIRCLNDSDPTPYVMVIGNHWRDHALRIWAAITVGDEDVEMTVEPDQSSKARNVLLFTKRPHEER